MKYLYGLLFIVCINIYGSGSLWNDIKMKTNNLSIPYIIDTLDTKNHLMVNRQEALAFFLRPIREVNQRKNRNVNPFNHTLYVDDSLVIEVEQWKGKNWDIADSISVACNTQNGSIFLIGKVTLHKGYTGLVWCFHREDLTYGVGPMTALFIYDSVGHCTDYEILGLHQWQGFEYTYCMSSKIDKNFKIESTIWDTGYEFYLTKEEQEMTDDMILLKKPNGTLVDRDANIVRYLNKTTIQMQRNYKITREGSIIENSMY